MRNRTCPCYKCESRTAYCKKECRLYNEWRAECAENRAKADAERAKYALLYNYQIESKARYMGKKMPMR